MPSTVRPSGTRPVTSVNSPEEGTDRFCRAMPASACRRDATANAEPSDALNSRAQVVSEYSTLCREVASAVSSRAAEHFSSAMSWAALLSVLLVFCTRRRLFTSGDAALRCRNRPLAVQL